MTRCELRTRGGTLWHADRGCGILARVKQPYKTNERQDADNILTLCSTITKEVIMLESSTRHSVAAFFCFANTPMVIPHNLVGVTS